MQIIMKTSAFVSKVGYAPAMIQPSMVFLKSLILFGTGGRATEPLRQKIALTRTVRVHL